MTSVPIEQDNLIEFENDVDETVPAETDKSERSAMLRKAYGAATTRLREDNRAEFDRLYSREASKLGVEYTPRLSPEDKAAQEVEELFIKFPALRERAAQRV